jgi:voltage-gated potassium channel
MTEFQRSLQRLLNPDAVGLTPHRARVVWRLFIGVGILVTSLRLTQGISPVAMAADVVVIGVLLFMTVDYALRLYSAPASPQAVPGRPGRSRLDYALSGAGLIDLVAFAPMLSALAAGASIEEVHAFGALWVLKLARYSKNLALMKDVVWNARGPLMSVLLLFGTVLLLTATAAHVLEGKQQPDDFGSIASSLWWAVATLTTTGYGDAVPISFVGRILSGVVMISGLAVFALWAGIFANGFSQELRRRDFLRTWELVARVPFFEKVGASAIANVADLLSPRTCPKDATIFWEGQHGDCMYFIVEGEVQISVGERGWVLEAGDFFGEVALVSGGLRTGRAVARSRCTLLALDVADFHGLAAQQPELSAAIRDRAANRADSA